MSPFRNSPPGASSTVPTASMPRTRGNSTPGEWPWRVNNSERFMPHAWTRMRTSPGLGMGMGIRSILRTSAEPEPCTTTAFIRGVVVDMVRGSRGCLGEREEKRGGEDSQRVGLVCNPDAPVAKCESLDADKFHF